MNAEVNYLIEQLQQVPVFSRCSAHNLARVIPGIEERKLEAGEILFRELTPATHLYLVIEGRVDLVTKQGVISRIDKGLLGEEAAVGEESYLSSAVAQCPTLVVSFPGESLEELQENEPSLTKDLFSSLLGHYTGKVPGQVKPPSIARKQEHSKWDLLGWLLAVLVPALILLFTSDLGLDWNSRLFLSVISTTIIMWTFTLTPSFLIPCVLAILVMLFLGIAPPSVVLSGFTSGSFFMAMSVFGLTVVLVASGITYRLILIALRHIPPSRPAYALVMFFTGFLMIPLIPSYSGRVSLITSPLLDMVDVLKYKPSGKASTQLTAAIFSGTTHFSSVFLTGTSLNLLIYGLFPVQVREQFSWGTWAVAAAVFTLVSIIGYLLLLFVMFRADEVPGLSRERIDAQLKILGPLNAKEWAALSGVLLFVIGIATSSMHKIDTPWIGMAILYIFLSMEFLSDEEFRKNINWPFLIYLGGAIGLVETLSYLGLDQWLVGHFSWMEYYMSHNFYLFVVLLIGSIMLLGLLVDEYTIITFFAAILFPMADSCGISPWVLGFIILTITGWWLLPHEDADFLFFSEVTNMKKKLFDMRSFLKFNAGTIVVRIIAIYVSIPFWKLLGLL